MSKLFWVVLAGWASFAAQAKAEEKSPLVHLKTIDPTIVQEMRYAGNHNFVGRPIKGYLAAECLLTEQAAQALKKVQAEVNEVGLGLKVYDCYRPQRAVDDFVAWAKDLKDTKMMKEFYPSVKKANLFKDGYIAAKSGHSRGSTVDITLVSVPPEAGWQYKEGDQLRDCRSTDQRFVDGSIDMGTGYDCFDPLAHSLNPKIKGAAKENRAKLRAVMERHGFAGLKEEWWHFTLKAEPFPDKYFDEEVK